MEYNRHKVWNLIVQCELVYYGKSGGRRAQKAGSLGAVISVQTHRLFVDGNLMDPLRAAPTHSAMWQGRCRSTRVEERSSLHLLCETFETKISPRP